MQTATSDGPNEIKSYATQKPTYASACLLWLTKVPVTRTVALVADIWAYKNVDCNSEIKYQM